MTGRQAIELPSHEDLSQLARADPVAYEALRREVIESFIASAPERIKPRLTGLQFRVDSVRRLSRSPLGATVKVYALMWDSFLCLSHNWQDFVRTKEDFLAGRGSKEATGFVQKGSAQILAFPPRAPRD